MDSTNWLSSIATVVIALGIVFAWRQTAILRKQLSADHGRSRREMTVALIQQWNGALTPASHAAQRLVRTFDAAQCQKLADCQALEVSAEHRPLVEICLADVLAPDEELQEVNGQLQLSQAHVTRLLFITAKYLNETEALLLAWRFSIADREMIEHQFSSLFQPAKGHDVLEKLRTVMGGKQSFPAIHEFLAVLQTKAEAGVPRPMQEVV